MKINSSLFYGPLPKICYANPLNLAIRYCWDLVSLASVLLCDIQGTVARRHVQVDVKDTERSREAVVLLL